ncbi:enterobactin exporter EntS [Streptomyces sp. YIM 130001]|uniref:MFS transporter n=1 Tax=Streptomyces sp. YIM 130001 TaxID=2259644 RepID=UPI000E64E4F4|nr:MFS transporter [Streptomyces sp. YIM 130001]RII13397.1 enterobactin exporter EntS [Streptomyces sp. YIM 130001]
MLTRRQPQADPRPARQDGDFRRLWAGDVVSQLGSQITLFVLPYMAVTTLHASADQVGLLQALYTLAFLLVPLPAGVWLENRARRPVLIWMCLISAGLVLSVPIVDAVGSLSLAHLYAVALMGGAGAVISDIAKVSLVPQLVGPDKLASANSRLNVGLAVGGTAGPGLAGWLTALVGASNALVLDGCSYLWCALMTSRLLHREPPPPADRPARNLPKEVREGLHTVFRTPSVRNIAVHAALNNAGAQLLNVVLVIHLVRDRGYGSAAYGLVLVCGGVGAVVGTLAAPRLIRTFGYGRAMLGVLAISVNAFWILPLVDGSRTVVVTSFALALGITSVGTGVGGVVSVTVRQLLTPPRLHSRMNASYRMVTYGTVPVGALLGGLLVERIGAQATLWILPFVFTAAVLPLVHRTVRSLGKTPDHVEHDLVEAEG